MYFIDEEDDGSPDEETFGLTYDEYMTGFSVLTIKEWTTYFGPEFEEFDFGFKRGMYGKGGLLIKSAALIVQGKGIREVCRLTGQSKNTVRKLLHVLKTLSGKIFYCPCGAPAGHQGWCSHRYQNSPTRQRFMREWQQNRKAAA